MQSINVAGFVRNSFIDYPGKISFVVFLGGCNFSCPHCHNHHILCASSNKLPLAQVLDEIKEQIGFIDGVAISGGEPTTHPHLREIITAIRELGLAVKLDTNGSNFNVLKSLVTEKLVDFVAMDIKAPIERYIELGFVKNQELVKQVKQSIEFLKENRVPFMFRTTPIPELSKNDMGKIKALVGDAPHRTNDFVEQEDF